MRIAPRVIRDEAINAFLRQFHPHDAGLTGMGILAVEYR
jgi:hypothetical protein